MQPTESAVATPLSSGTLERWATAVNQPTATHWHSIRDLVAEEKNLRAQLQHRDITESEEHDRLRRVEVELDQCWDLLRQRRALRETGGDPREAAVRPADQVEGYLG